MKINNLIPDNPIPVMILHFNHWAFFLALIFMALTICSAIVLAAFFSTELKKKRWVRLISWTFLLLTMVFLLVWQITGWW